MTYELAKQLKDAGFPQTYLNGWDSECKKEHTLGMATGCCGVFIPSLSELIEACGGGDFDLRSSYIRLQRYWIATLLTNDTASSGGKIFQGKSEGSTPEEAVAKLWLELNKI